MLLPLQAGKLEGQEFQVKVGVYVPTGERDFWGQPIQRPRSLVLSAPVPNVEILPLPTPQPASFSGAVGNLNLTRTVSRDTINGDESITVTVRVEGYGNLSAVELPELIVPDGFEVYEPKYSEKISATSKGMRGFKQNEYLLVPKYKGVFNLPPWTWSSFDPATAQYTIAEIAQHSITVLTGSDAPTGTSSSNGVVKRHVVTLAEDLRYLQTVEAPTHKLPIWLSALLGGIALALAWLWLLIKPVKKAGLSYDHLAILHGVENAFKNNNKAGYGAILNAFEEWSKHHGLPKTAFNPDSCVALLPEQHRAPAKSLLETCQMIEFAPVSPAQSEQHLKSFIALWKEI